MGTQKTMQFKFQIAERILSQTAEQMNDIYKEEMVYLIMRECLCERRKALELFNALIPKFPYKESEDEEGKICYLFQFSSQIVKNPEHLLTNEENSILEASNDEKNTITKEEEWK